MRHVTFDSCEKRLDKINNCDTAISVDHIGKMGLINSCAGQSTPLNSTRLFVFYFGSLSGLSERLRACYILKPLRFVRSIWLNG
jgi:hypothetical protein